MKTRTGRRIGRWLLVMGLGVACLAPRTARAGDGGTGSGGTPTISPELVTTRYNPGSDAGAPSHAGAAAINYADCTSGIDIELSLDLSNAPAGDEIQVWAGSGSADCTQTSARTAAASTTPTDFPGRCWPAAAPNAFDPTKSTATARLHVRDLVAYIGQQNPPIAYAPTTDVSVCKPYATNSAVQLNLYFLYAPVGSEGATSPPAVTGVSGLYSTVAALVGPYAPQGITVPNTGITATSLTVNWEPQAETTIAGFNIYAQDEGSNGLSTGIVVDGSATLVTGVQCHPALACEAGSASDDSGDDSGDDAGDDAGDAGDGGDSGKVDGATKDAGLHDATLDAGDASDAGDAGDATLHDSGSGGGTACDAGLSDAWVPEDAAAFAGMSEAGLAALGCEYTAPVNAQNPPTSGGNACVSGVLTSVFQVDGGLGSIAIGNEVDSGVVTTTTDDADTDADIDGGVDGGPVVVATVDAGTVSTTPGTIPETAGISAISSRYLNAYADMSDANSYTLTGLTTGHQYAITVAAVDSYGNVGPVGNLGCSTPTPVDDFYMMYTDDGGTAGGGFCALGAPGAAPGVGSVFGFGIAGSAVALARRRRRVRSKS